MAPYTCTKHPHLCMKSSWCLAEKTVIFSGEQGFTFFWRAFEMSHLKETQISPLLWNAGLEFIKMVLKNNPN